MILTKEKSAILGTKNGTGEGVACLKRWYVAHVRIHHEKKVAEYLGKMGIETFVPVQQEIHQWSDRRKLVETVLLPMMVFVHADPKERMAALTLATVSRYMVLRGEGKPAVIPDDQMARFRFMLLLKVPITYLVSFANLLYISDRHIDTGTAQHIQPDSNLTFAI